MWKNINRIYCFFKYRNHSNNKGKQKSLLSKVFCRKSQGKLFSVFRTIQVIFLFNVVRVTRKKGRAPGTLSYILVQRRSVRNGGKRTRCILDKNRDFLPKLKSLPCFARSRLAPLLQQLTITGENRENTRDTKLNVTIRYRRKQ